MKQILRVCALSGSMFVFLFTTSCNKLSISLSDLYGDWVCKSSDDPEIKTSFRLYNPNKFSLYTSYKLDVHRYYGTFSLNKTDESLVFRSSPDDNFGLKVFVRGTNYILYDDITDCRKVR